MDRILTSGEIIDFMESRSIGPISGSAELFLLCQIAYELKLAREEKESSHVLRVDYSPPHPPMDGGELDHAVEIPSLPARHPEAIVDKGKRRK